MPTQEITIGKETLLLDGWDEVFEDEPQPGVKPKIGACLRRLLTPLERKKCVHRWAALWFFADWWTWLRALLGELCDEARERWRRGRYALWTGLAPPQEPQTIPRK